MFAEFERDAHAMAERGEALNPAALNNLYKKLIVDYFGPELVCLLYTSGERFPDWLRKTPYRKGESAMSEALKERKEMDPQYQCCLLYTSKVSEHFAQDGKPLDSLLEDVIQHAAAAS